MKIESVTTDNITDLLVKIIEFTNTRKETLTANINYARKEGYKPKDLPVDEFSKILNIAIEEHIKNKRLVFHDSENIKFGFAGSMEIKFLNDKYAKELLENNMDEYLEYQVNKLMENSMNEKLAAELIKQKNGAEYFFKE